MTVFNEKQQDIASRIDNGTDLSQWRDWRWQMRNAIRSTDVAERLLGIRFPDLDRRAFRQTAAKFPVRVTPYYLSLIDNEDWRNCPVFRL